ncbi:MAG: hypothetical protein H6573_05610 [Lewinellaceae bacterium]|nr:hypothetical protein [Lewinellaceae bacterium]
MKSQHLLNTVWLGIEHEHLFANAFDPFCLPANNRALGNPVDTYRMKEIHDNTPDKNDAKEHLHYQRVDEHSQLLHTISEILCPKN